MLSATAGLVGPAGMKCRLLGPRLRPPRLSCALGGPHLALLPPVAHPSLLRGFFTLGRVEAARRAGYRGSRGPWADKVTWRD